MRVLYSKNLVFISKPRCGSTSIRKTLDQYAQQQKGDFGVDYADEYPPYHPHITAPHLKKLLKINFPSRVFPESFICIRHPLDCYFHTINTFPQTGLAFIITIKDTKKIIKFHTSDG